MQENQNPQSDPRPQCAVYGYTKNNRRIGVYQDIIDHRDLPKFSDDAKLAFENLQRGDEVKSFLASEKAFVVVLGGKS